MDFSGSSNRLAWIYRPVDTRLSTGLTMGAAMWEEATLCHFSVPTWDPGEKCVTLLTLLPLCSGYEKCFPPQLLPPSMVTESMLGKGSSTRPREEPRPASPADQSQARRPGRARFRAPHGHPGRCWSAKMESWELAQPTTCMWSRMRGNAPPKWNLCMKSCVFILTSLNSVTFEGLSIWCDPPVETFFSHCTKQFLNLLILMPFSASAIFCFTSSTRTKHFPLRTFFIQGEKEKVTWSEIG